MFTLAGSITRRTAVVAIALLLGLIAALMTGPAAAHAITAHRHGHHNHHNHRGHRHHGNRHHRHGDRRGVNTVHSIRADAPHRSGSESSPTENIANSLLVMLNREREERGLAAMTMNTELVRSAHAHNLWMARTNTMSHQETGEPDLATRIDKTGYKWTWAGENIGWNSEMTKAGVLQLESIMYHEKAPDNGHRLNILSSHFKNVGVDVYMDKANGKVWLTTDFGRH